MKNIMKISILMLSLLVIVTGCGGSEKTNNVEPEKEKEVTFEEAYDTFNDMIDDGEEFTMELIDNDGKFTLYFLSDDSFVFIEDVDDGKMSIYCNIEGESRAEYDGEEEFNNEMLDDVVSGYCSEDISELYDEILEDMDYFLEDVDMDEYEEDGDKLVLEFEDEDITMMSITKDSKELIAKDQNRNESFTFTIGKVKLPK